MTTNDLPQHSRIQHLLWVIFIAFGLFWYIAFRFAQPLTQEPFSPGFHGNDFKHIYLGSWLLLQHENPYDARIMLRTASERGLGAINPYVYPPFTGLVMAPLAMMDPPQALVAWFLLNHLFMIAAIALIFLSLPLEFDLPNLTAAVWLCALCFPLQRTLTAGQLNCALLFLFALVYFLEKRGHAISAGATGAFAFLYKLIPGVLFPYFLWKAMIREGRELCRPSESTTSSNARQPKGWILTGSSTSPTTRSARVHALACLSFASMAIAALLFIALSIWFAGLKTNLNFLPVLSQMGYGKSTWAELGNHFYRDPSNQSFNSFFHHIFAGGDSIAPWISLGPNAANAFTWAASILILIVLAWRLWPREYRTFDSNFAYALFILFGLLIPSIYWDHYAMIAIWPLLAVWKEIESRLKLPSLVLFFLLVIPLSNYLSFPIWLTALFLITAALTMGALMLRSKWHGGLASVWAISAAALCARFAYDLPAFRHGAGLLLMSAKLWPTLLLFGLLLYLVRTPQPSKQNP